jgi:hypothetical protein
MKVIVHEKSWDELRSKLKYNYPELINTDLDYSSDKQEEMLRMVAYKLGKSRKELRDIILNL